jgi:ribose-phosphate pyrophosphokinase
LNAPPLLFRLYADDTLCDNIAAGLGAERGRIEQRRFPDGESYVRILSDCAGRDVVMVCGLDHPDEKVVALIFAAATLRDLGAQRLTLVAPYFPYLRQDQRFHSGESVSARHFGALIARYFDALITVDPHLHRIHDLATVCPITCRTVPAAPAIAAWIKGGISRPVIVGPDAESEQWVAAVADLASAPYCVGEKVRRGDRDVTVSLSDIGIIAGHTPVLIDDIISTGRTMAAVVELLAGPGRPPPVCVGVHALFDDETPALLQRAGAGEVVTCNTITHRSNAIDLAVSIVAGVVASRPHDAR